MITPTLSKTLLALVSLLHCSVPGAEPTSPVGSPVGSPAGSPAGSPEDSMVRYHVTLPERQAHRVAVRMSLHGLSGPELQLSMPVWTPGSYLVREYARNVLDLSASAPDGSALVVSKISKDSWSIALGEFRAATIDYVLYANEVSVRTSHVTVDHAFLQPAATFLRHGPSADGPHRVTVETPPGWQVFTSMPAEGDGHLADDYDMLIDSPLEVGPFEALEFQVNDVPHRLVLAGVSDVDAEQLRDDMAAICVEIATIFGQMPFDDYTFLVPLVDAGGGGLEHKNSSVCMTSRWGLSDEKRYRRFLSLVAHEYFHAWNVKRFRPASLGPFDYSRENYTPDLWVSEGITSYYDDLSVLRAGFAESAKDYLRARAKAFRSEAERPGGERTSLSRSSLDTWIKQYRPDENSRNHTVSYYSKGALVGLMLDLRIRRLTDGRRSLADALRLGWQRYTEQGVGFPAGGLAELVTQTVGADMSSFFADYVDGTAPLQPDDELAWVGLRLHVEPAKTERDLPEDDDEFALAPWLGLTTRGRNGLCAVDVVLEGGPAFVAGLNHDDIILAVDDVRVSADNLQSRLDRRAGESVTISFYRGQDLRSLTIQPELRRLETWKLVSVDEPSERQLEAYRNWTGFDHPSQQDDEEDDEQDPEAEEA